MKIGDLLPPQTVFQTNTTTMTAKQLYGKKMIIYFYPKDDTPGCTIEGKDFEAARKDFEQANCTIIGVSKDNLASHQKFIKKYGFGFYLATDEDQQLCTLFDVIKPKNMYGKTYMGIERSTFVFDKAGILKKEWRKVKVPGHVKEVYEYIQDI